ncbi:hypothetical protein HPB52_002735 [Rhipicephalus sanguineus]|uniref:Uncharacterized protein n=1 Tax=Rhipicephalus sanguineus TaxID=34632 RepID=A0A9D4PH91_RHISA|nr:hypothetical protein HPB52_002735 [Rhipicephalus sanguineus]
MGPTMATRKTPDNLCPDTYASKTPDTYDNVLYISVLTSRQARSDGTMDLTGPGASADSKTIWGTALSSSPRGRVIDTRADASPTTASREKEGDASRTPQSGGSEQSYARTERGGGRVWQDQP